ncbi:hypothetical protein FSP39_020437 [Pinctada imbricata]|uniref:Potassium channel tetramerisation-type BTB domain-containing protein n=1 Tax=Pinctada imbricata TaxID=66713 RepID=A0AA88YKY9_PINIB|nr:hypothetical protein FSP39_020437 [Pinctada imbricata]
MEYPDATLARSLQDKGEEVEFKRSLICFEAIRDFYVCGKLHMPSSVCPTAFKEELHFWNIPDTKIELCCALKYQTYLDEMRSVEKFRLREAQLIDSKNNLHGRKNEIWKVLDNQSKSILNTVYNIVSTALVLCSIVIMTVNMEHQMPGENESNTTQHQNVSMTPLQPESSDTQRDDTTIDILCVKDLSHEEEEQLFLMERICIKDCRRIEKPNFDTCSQQNKCSVDMWNSFKGHVFFNEICQECWPLFFPGSTC